MAIITSLLDTDFYKLTMQQVVLHQFSNVNVRYDFRLRNYPTSIIDGKMKDEIRKEVDSLCELRFKREELDYLKTIPFLSKDYIEFLRNFQLNKDDIIMGFVYSSEHKGFQLFIKGTWLNAILFETPVLAIISEIFCKYKYTKYNFEGYERLDNKIKEVKSDNSCVKSASLPYSYDKPLLKFADFGTRRRMSKDWQDEVIRMLSRSLPNNFIGTSNVYFAKKFNIKPIGTMAHEYIQAMQSLVRLRDSQRYALQCWSNEYRGNLGIALSDTLGINAFLNDFDLYFAKLFSGIRQDSGNPFDVAEKVLEHYEKLGIDSKTKSLVFTDGLTIPKAIKLNDAFHEDFNCSFGIGTNLTNDCGFKAPQIVIKMTECNGSPVAKISDSEGKQMCNDKDHLKHLIRVFNIKK